MMRKITILFSILTTQVTTHQKKDGKIIKLNLDGEGDIHGTRRLFMIIVSLFFMGRR
jgi:hypothetical protein